MGSMLADGDTWDISSALTTFGDVFKECANLIKGNEVLMVFLCGGLLILGFKVFKRARKAVK